MTWLKDPPVLLMIGAIALLVGGLGALLMGTLFGLPVSLGAAALGYTQEQAITVIVYGAVLWLPLGFGMGLGTALKFVKGYKALGGDQTSDGAKG